MQKTIGVKELCGQWHLLTLGCPEPNGQGETPIPLTLNDILATPRTYKFAGFSRSGRLIYHEVEE